MIACAAAAQGGAREARADVDLSRRQDIVLHTGIYSGEGRWSLSAGSLAIELDVAYDARGRLVGEAVVGQDTFEVRGRARLRHGAQTLDLRSLRPRRGRLRLIGVVDGPEGTCTGRATLRPVVGTTAFRNARLTGSIPAGSHDRLTVGIDLLQDAGGALTGAGDVIPPHGRAIPLHAVRGSVADGAAGERVRLKLRDERRRVLRIDGVVDDLVLSGSADVRVPGFRARAVPTTHVVAPFAIVLTGDVATPFTTDVPSLLVAGSLIDRDGVGFPTSLTVAANGATATIPVDGAGRFEAVVAPLTGLDERISISIGGATPLATLAPTYNPGFAFGGRLQLDPDVAYVGEPREITARVALLPGTPDVSRVLLLDADSGALLAEMADDGDAARGDDLRGDGVHTARFVASADAPGTIRVRVRVELADQTHTTSEVAELTVARHLTAADLALSDELHTAHQAALAALTDPALVRAKARAVLGDVRSRPGVCAAGLTARGDGVWFEHASGLRDVIVAPLPGTASGAVPGVAPAPAVGSVDRKPQRYVGAYAARPALPAKVAFDDVIGHPSVFALAAFSAFEPGYVAAVGPMTDALVAGGARSIGAAFVAPARGAGSIELLKDLDRYGIVLVETHGGLLYRDQAVLDTNVAWGAGTVAAYEDDLVTGRLVRLGDGVGVLPAFLERYTGRMPNSLVYVNACGSAADGRLATVLLSRGAGAFLGYSGTVTTAYAAARGRALAEALVTPCSAVRDAMVGGVADENGGTLVLLGNDRLSIGTGQVDVLVQPLRDPLGSGGLISDACASCSVVEAQQAFDDFSLPAATTITGVRWTGFHLNVDADLNPATQTSIGWRVEVWSDDAGVPGVPLTAVTLEADQVRRASLGQGLSTFYGDDAAVELVAFEAPLATPFGAQADTVYWLSIVSQNSGARTSAETFTSGFVWAPGGDESGVSFFRYIEGDTALFPGDLAFALTTGACE